MRKKTLEIWGLWQLGTHTHDLTNASYSPSRSERNSFYSWAITPHLEEIWGFEIFKSTVYGRPME